MFRILIFCCSLFVSQFAFGQISNRLGINLGSTVAWPASDAVLDNGFFTVSRAGFQGGLVNTMSINDRWIISIGANTSVQSFALRQTGLPEYSLDARYKALQFEVPITFGFSGYLGSMRHREFIGAAMQSNLALNPKLVLNGDSTAGINAVITTSSTSKVYPVLLAGFEIGTRFDNDGAMFFGVCFRYGMQEAYTGTLTTNIFPDQKTVYNGSYLGFGLTYYLPRYSYWFKREFIY
jgi:hypothetical protein